MEALISGIILVGAIFGFAIAAAKACDPAPIKSYYIVWENDWLIEYSEIIEAHNVASAWRKLCRKHFFNKPQRIVSIEEV